MKEKRRHGMVLAVVLVLALLTGGIVQAEGYDMTAPGASIVINGAIFEVFNPADASGSGQFDSFVRISSNTLVIQGYNTDYRPLQFEENSSPSFTNSQLLSEVPQFNVGGTWYREFQLDINQLTSGNSRFLTLDNVELYESAVPDLCGYPFDGSGGGHSGCPTSAGDQNTATMVYGMDEGEDNFMVLDYTNNTGSGKRDLRLYVPNNYFNTDPNCWWGGEGCAIYVTLYSKFGGDSDPAHENEFLRVAYGNNDGFEEWGVRAGEPTAITLQDITVQGGPAGPGLAALGIGLLALSTGLFLALRRRQPVSS
jgi:hypothetical protein